MLSRQPDNWTVGFVACVITVCLLTIVFKQLDEEEYFNADYVEVDRVLDESVVKDPTTNEDARHYLVKWQSLPYEDSTWELEKDVDKVKIEAFRKFKELPAEEDRIVSVAFRAGCLNSSSLLLAKEGGLLLQKFMG